MPLIYRDYQLPIHGIAIAEPRRAGVPRGTSDKEKKEECPMQISKKICSALLLVTLLALAGCPEVSQDSGSSQSSGSRGSSGD